MESFFDRQAPSSTSKPASSIALKDRCCVLDSIARFATRTVRQRITPGIPAGSMVVFNIFLLALFPLQIGATTIHYSYDENGNMTGDGRYYYEYNDDNRLVRIRDSGPNGIILATYTYDSNGHRIKKIENGRTTYYVTPHYEKVVTKNEEDEINYFFINKKRIAKIVNKKSAIYYHQNHINSTDAITNLEGRKLGIIRYYPYGERREGGSERYLYTGKELELTDNSYCIESRRYTPMLHTFQQADTIIPNTYEPISYNRYVYANNNPLSRIDPSGHYPVNINKLIRYSVSKTIDFIEIMKKNSIQSAPQVGYTFVKTADYALKAIDIRSNIKEYNNYTKKLQSRKRLNTNNPIYIQKQNEGLKQLRRLEIIGSTILDTLPAGLGSSGSIGLNANPPSKNKTIMKLANRSAIIDAWGNNNITTDEAIDLLESLNNSN